MEKLIIDYDLIENQYQNNKDIEEVIIKGNVTTIPEGCFAGCNNLKKVTFEDGVTDIEACAFFDCKNLNKIVVSDTMKTIKDFSFHNCNKDVIVDSNNKLNNVKFGVNNDVISTYFVLPEIGVSFRKMSWNKIHMISEQGLAKDYFSIGDEKQIVIKRYNYNDWDYKLNRELIRIHPETTYYIQIIGFDHDNKSNGTGKAGITVCLRECLYMDYRMNTKDTNTGGWEKSNMRNYINNNIYNNLPLDLQLVIKKVNKISDIGNNNKKDLTMTEDKLFLLSSEEIGFIPEENYGITPGQGEKYEYFNNNYSRIKAINNFNSCWWLRSSEHAYYFCCVNDNGGCIYASSNISFGVVPAFCI